MGNSIITADMLARVVEQIDPEWHLNPPEPGTPAWNALTDEQRLRLIPRLLARIHTAEQHVRALRERFGVSEARIGGITVQTSHYMPPGVAALTDRQGRLLGVLSLTEGR